MPAFHVGTHDAACAVEFMYDLAGRLANRVQLTSDGNWAYLVTVEDDAGRRSRDRGETVDDERFTRGAGRSWRAGAKCLR